MLVVVYLLAAELQVTQTDNRSASAIPIIGSLLVRTAIARVKLALLLPVVVVLVLLVMW